MNVECPACSSRGKIDGTTVPKEGRELACPRCGKRFRIWPERSGVEIIQQRERMRCPKCGCEQPLAESCAVCGIIMQKHMQAEERRREREQLESAKIKSDLRQVDSWYSDLFDRRLSSLLVRVLSLLVLIGMLMTCSINSARRNKYLAENTAAMRTAAEGPTRAKPDDKKILADLFTFEGHVRDAAYQCMNQCDRYSVAWYDKAEPGMNMYREHHLDSAMAETLDALRGVKRTLDRDLQLIATPSKQYWPYYHKVKGLYNVYVSLYELATNQDTHYYDFRGIVSRHDMELREVIRELEDLRPKELSTGGGQ